MRSTSSESIARAGSSFARLLERAILLVRRQRAVQRHDVGAGAEPRPHVGHRTRDLRRSGKKPEHGAWSRTESHHGDVGQRFTRAIADGNRMETPGNVDDRTAVEKRGYGAGLERRGHDNDAQVIAREPGLARQRQAEVGMDAALVEFVEHDRAEGGEQRILLEPRGEDAFRREEHAGAGGEPALEAHLPADLIADRPALFACDPPRDRARRKPPRLQHDDGAVRRQDRRHTRRLSRARCGRDNDGAARDQRVTNRGEIGIDGQRLGHVLIIVNARCQMSNAKRALVEGLLGS
ncbi:MAG: hypothetical protein DMF85_01080 [Acidobacteria bacterium]|nr:MAG: hypothetical protein DMF85_01080 [Acidobacteriota bacterium]